MEMEEPTVDEATSLLQQELDDWNNQIKELYLLKSLSDPLSFDLGAPIVNPLEFQVFLKSRNIFTKYQIDAETLEPLKDSLISKQLAQYHAMPRSPSSFGSLMMINPLVLHSNDSNSQLYHQPPSDPSDSVASSSKFTPMDLYQFYLECKQLPTSQLLQSSQRTVTSKNWISSRRELKACRIIQRLEYLKESGACVMHFPANSNQSEPKPKAHLDWMLDEMRWFATEVWEERKWRKQVAKQLALEAQQCVENKMRQDEGAKVSFPVTVAKFLASVHSNDGHTVTEGILGPPKPSHLGATVSMQCWEGTFVPLVSSTPNDANGKEHFYCSLFPPSDASTSLEDKVLLSLAQMYSNNWPVVFEHLTRIVPTCTFQSPTDCSRRWKTFSTKRPSSLPILGDGGDAGARKDSSPQSGAFALAREYELLVNKEIDEFIRITDTIYTNVQERPNRWNGTGTGLPKKVQSIPWNKNAAFQAHPSHDAALKKHSVSDQQVSVSDLAFKRNKISNNATTQNANSNNQPITLGHPHATSPTNLPQREPGGPAELPPPILQRPVNTASPVFNVPIAAPVMIVDNKAPMQVANTPAFGMRVPANPIFTAPPQGTTPIGHMQAAPFGASIPYPTGIPIPHPKRVSAMQQPPTSTTTRRTSKKSSTELVLDE